MFCDTGSYNDYFAIHQMIYHSKCLRILLVLSQVVYSNFIIGVHNNLDMNICFCFQRNVQKWNQIDLVTCKMPLEETAFLLRRLLAGWHRCI